MARPLVPLYYVLLSGLRGEWASLVQIEAESGFPATAHPHRRAMLDVAVSLWHAETMTKGKRVFYRLTPVGEDYLDSGFEVFGPVSRWRQIYD